MLWIQSFNTKQYIERTFSGEILFYLLFLGKELKFSLHVGMETNVGFENTLMHQLAVHINE